jgi:WD40 repeat protein
VIYSPDNAKFATGGFKDGSNIWDAKTGELFIKLDHDHKYWVYDITLSRNIAIASLQVHMVIQHVCGILTSTFQSVRPFSMNME